MGGMCSETEGTENDSNQTNISNQSNTQNAPIDKSLFIQKEKTNETIQRDPGQINGNQFVADKLENCKVIIHDYCDSMTIDRSNNCEFVLSAVKGSIFIRDCNNCKFVMVCGQFRCRDCKDCQFFMHVKTGPVIESSQNLTIGCAQIYYPELLDQMKQACLIPEVNIWNDIHDFTPAEGNFHYADGEVLQMDILGPIDQSPLPLTHIKSGSSQIFVVTLSSGYHESLVDIAKKVKIVKSGLLENSEIELNVEGNSMTEIDNLFASMSPISISAA